MMIIIRLHWSSLGFVVRIVRALLRKPLICIHNVASFVFFLKLVQHVLFSHHSAHCLNLIHIRVLAEIFRVTFIAVKRLCLRNQHLKFGHLVFDILRGSRHTLLLT